MRQYILLALGIALSATAIQAQAPADPYAGRPAPTDAQVVQACQSQYSGWNDPGRVPVQALTFRPPTQSEITTMCTCMAREIKATGAQAGTVWAAITDPNFMGGTMKRDFQLGVLRYRGAVRLPDGTWTHKGADPKTQARNRYWDNSVLFGGMDPEQAAMAKALGPRHHIHYGTEGTRQRIFYTQFYEKARECRPVGMSVAGFEHMDSYAFLEPRVNALKLWPDKVREWDSRKP